MTDTSPPPAGPPAPGFDSLTEMQTRHAELVKGVGADVLAAGHAELVTGFIARAAATGRVLDSHDDRTTAQGLINFWVARLSSAARAAGKKGAAGGVAPQFDDTVLDAFDAGTIRASAAVADAWLAGRPEAERAVARRMLLRLVRLQPDGKRFDPVPTVRAAFYDLDDPGRVDAVIDGMAAAGVVRVSRAEAAEMDRVALRSADLLDKWPAMKEWADGRRRFREEVAGWDRAGRPSAVLYYGERLEEARSYFDRDARERSFVDQSRRREWRKNELNRVLKFVFGGLALAALVGWVFAAVSYYHMKEEARAAREAQKKEEAAGTALKQEQQTILRKQELTSLRLLVRGLGELAAAEGVSDRDIALARWNSFAEQVRTEDQFASLRGLELNALRDHALNPDRRRKLTGGDISRIRELRNPTLADPKVYPSLKAMRDVSFDMVRLSAARAVGALKTGHGYADAAPYVAEFWTQYWGEMLLVEGEQVEREMVAFGRALAAVREPLDTPDPNMTSQLATLAKKYGRDDKAFADKLPSVRVNAASFAQLSHDLGLPKEELNRLLKQGTDRTVTDPELVKRVDARLKPLLDALEAERGKPILPYSAATAM